MGRQGCMRNKALFHGLINPCIHLMESHQLYIIMNTGNELFWPNRLMIANKAVSFWIITIHACKCHFHWMVKIMTLGHSHETCNGVSSDLTCHNISGEQVRYVILIRLIIVGLMTCYTACNGLFSRYELLNKYFLQIRFLIEASIHF